LRFRESIEWKEDAEFDFAQDDTSEYRAKLRG
jgi:hypothetical protein